MKKVIALIIFLILIFNSSIDTFAHSMDLDFYMMFEEHGTIMLLINADTGGIEYANAAASNFYGYSIEKLEAMNINEINMIEQVEVNRRIQIATNEETSFYELEQRLSSGEVRTVEVYACPHTTGDKTVIFATIYDITDRILLEQRNEFINNVLFFALLGIFLITALFIYIICGNYKKIKAQSHEISNFNDFKNTYIDADKNLVYLKDENLKYVFANKALLNFLNKTNEEVIGHDVFDIAEEDYATKSKDICLKILEKNESIVEEIHFNNKIYQASKFPVKLPNGHNGVGAYIQDITEEYMIKEKLKEINTAYNRTNTLLNAILESSPEIIIFALDTNYCYFSFNNLHKEIMKRIWGKEIEIGMNMLKAIGEHDDSIKAKESFDKALSGQSFKVIEEYGDENLYRLIWQNYYSPVYTNGEVFGITCFVLNITEQKKAEEEVLYLSYHDELTGLYNRRFLEEEFKRLDVDKNLPISIIVGDMNGLKLTNDIFGHSAGDVLLQKVAGVLKSVCRSNDIIARLGGDEFTIILPKTNEKQAHDIIFRVKNQFSKETVKAIEGSISMGCDTKKYVNEDLQQILRNAEDRMYYAKTIERENVKSTTIETIINSLHKINPKEESHSINVSSISEKIGQAMKLSEVEIRILKDAGYYHDIGKVVLNESLLTNSNTLTEQEQKEMNQHPIIGYRILNSFNHTLDLAELILAHHENWDGSGYPKGIKGEEIPKLARIIAIADSYDSMTSKNEYKMSCEEAKKELKKLSNTTFDSSIVDIFITIISNICED